MATALEQMSKTPPDFLSEEERIVLLGVHSTGLEKKTVTFRLTKEARDLIAKEAGRLDTDKTTALEIIIRRDARRKAK